MCNSGLGIAARIDTEAGVLVAAFDGREVSRGFGELDALVPAHATAVHRAQDSQDPAVVVPVVMQYDAMLARDLLRAGVARGARVVVSAGPRPSPCRSGMAGAAAVEARGMAAGVWRPRGCACVPAGPASRRRASQQGAIARRPGGGALRLHSRRPCDAADRSFDRLC